MTSIVAKGQLSITGLMKDFSFLYVKTYLDFESRTAKTTLEFSLTEKHTKSYGT